MDSLRKAGDSCGARIRVVARGMPVGLGQPIYDRLDADIAHAMMGLNAVKGVEIGAGFASVGKAAAQPEQVIQVLIDAQEKIEVKSTGTTSTQISVNLSSLPQQVMQLQGGNANTPVVISADKGIKYETVVKVMDSLQRAGVQRVGLSVQLQP